MAFRFAARTLLELGKELISSDEVALYELIKNAVDARSQRTEIRAQIVLTRQSYNKALEALDAGKKTAAVFEQIRLALVGGTTSEIQSGFLDAIRPAIGNKRRFTEALDGAYSSYNWFEIVDTGHGMSLRELDEVFLTIGTRSRRAANVAGQQYLGDKGVGRLSAMRLGEILSITTSRENEPNWHRLEVDWRLYSHESQLEVHQIAVAPFEGPAKADRALHGTTIRISNLSGEWNGVRFEEVFSSRIARMLDPFEPGRGNRLLRVVYNGQRIIVPSIPDTLLTAAHAVCKASFRFENDEPVFDGVVDYTLRQKQRVVAQRGAEVYSIAQNVWKRRGKKGHAAFATEPLRPAALKALGPFEVEIYWFNRRVVEAIAGLTDSIQATRDEVAKWSGGPMLFRHGFRILPYGDPGDDWLELDHNAFGSSGFKLNRQQVVGRVTVHAGHAALSEQTNREGLVRSESADALKTLLMWLVHGEMRGLINAADKAEQINSRSAEKVAYEFRATEKEVVVALDQLRKRVGPAGADQFDRLSKLVHTLSDQCESLVGKTGKIVEGIVEEREKFVHLAGIGLMTEFIFHELDRSVNHTLKSLSAPQAMTPATLKSLEDQLITLQKRISAFDEISGERRQTKSTFDVADIVDLVLENHRGQASRHGISLRFIRPSKPLILRAVRGMVIQILENMVANAVYWLKEQVRYEPGFQPEIVIDIDPADRALTVEDNGPGIDPRRRETIFEPYITSKPPGQGRGLGLYISRELAHYHGWQLYLDKAAGRKRPNRLSLFVLDFGDEK